MFFDTETDGLPKDYKASYEELANWPRVIAISWMLCSETAEVLSFGNYLIKPDGWEIPTGKFWVDNGFSQAKSMAEGTPIREVLELFMANKMAADFLVAHNLNFDHRITWAEYLRAGITPRSGMNKICTMMKTIKFVGARYPNGRAGKFPTLTELHKKLFGKGFEGAHDAKADMLALKNCFFKLLAMNVISLTPDTLA